jgi:Protein of unknown function (DUF2505)
MQSVRIQHEFDCSEDTLWQLSFFDEDFNRRLYLETLRFPVWKVLEQKVTDATLTRRVEIHPLVENLPAPVKKLMGDRFAYVEEGTLDRIAKRYKFRVTPSTMADKTRIAGELFMESLGEKKVRRIVEFSVEVKVFVVGSVVEQKTIEDTKASYDKSAAFTRAYLKEKGLGG